MRRICLALLMLIFIVQASFGIAGEDLESMKFKLFFQKPGETDFHFTRRGTTTMTEEEAFDSYLGGSVQSVSASFGFDWALYYDGNVTMTLVFASNLANADKSYDDPGFEDFMLWATDDVTYYQGLNYTAKVANGTGDGEVLKGTIIGNASHDDRLPSTARSVVLLDSKQLSDISGSKGHVDIDLTLTIPPKEGEMALMRMQYEGVVKMYIESN